MRADGHLLHTFFVFDHDNNHLGSLLPHSEKSEEQPVVSSKLLWTHLEQHWLLRMRETLCVFVVCSSCVPLSGAGLYWTMYYLCMEQYVFCEPLLLCIAAQNQMRVKNTRLKFWVIYNQTKCPIRFRVCPPPPFFHVDGGLYGEGLTNNFEMAYKTNRGIHWIRSE